MKNLLIYISSTGSFYNERLGLVNDGGSLVKVQIENSIALGWKPKDILLYTNFDYQYGIIKARVLKNVEYFDRKLSASKINGIIKLFEDGLIKKGELYWFHDLDAFQLVPVTASEIKLAASDIALTDYGRVSKWSTGTIFFKSGSYDIFCRIKEVMYEKRIDEKEALGLLTINNKDIGKRVKKLNSTYDFNGFNLRQRYKTAIKPIRVVHFHPYGVIRRLGVKRPLDFFMGQNSLHIPLITDRLIKIFKFHRIR